MEQMDLALDLPLEFVRIVDCAGCYLGHYQVCHVTGTVILCVTHLSAVRRLPYAFHIQPQKIMEALAGMYRSKDLSAPFGVCKLERQVYAA